MSPLGASNRTTKDPQEGRKHGKHGFHKFGKHGKKAASAHDNEDAPLLADDAPNEDVEANAVEEPATKGEKTKRWLQKAGHWTWSNKMILALVLLLIGGIITVVVYFAGMFVLRISVLFGLGHCSW